ncbi:MAG: hypothetical protein O9282_13565 [Flavobacterium sp.]|jgi:hypothetical protein|uniref:hypothetical protein n=1 Tax=Flavobacterium sp. TaxID=239 RepID=UPI0022C8008B|nr:hypothetical protein [Flavobacterium sp.]MCZ8091411.1 hypothetical protein [Flavobacterium sp.]MCZ8332334.1 hypothetical protein [Flavobacterium sp.]
MKKLLFFIVISLYYSCAVHNKPVQKNDNELTQIEKNIINAFLDAELDKERYYRFKNYKHVVIEEALKKIKSIDTYLYSLDEWSTMNKINKSEDVKNMYFLDTMQIKKIKNNLKDEEVYLWKTSDFKKDIAHTFKFEELRKTTNTGEYLQNRLIIYLSRPLIIDENNAFISFEIGNGDFGFYPITHFTVLMRKKENKWVESGFYEDGVF